MNLAGRQNVPIELSFRADGNFDCVFVDPEGRELRVPAFWSGGDDWRVRYASPQIGFHRFEGPEAAGTLEIRPYEGNNPLLLHGPPRVSRDGRTLEHLDGTPFLWVADTWWFAFVERLGWPDDFQRLTADRVEKGFSVIQVIAGLYGEVPPFDERGGDEWPWKEGFTAINPAWWDAADLRIAWLVRCGLVPCIVGAWGYYLSFAGLDVMREHWRNVIARYGAYPVVWCVAGETKHPYYDVMFSDRSAEIAEDLGVGWTDITRFVREADPYQRVMTTHPSPGDGTWSSHDVFADDPSLYDLNMIHTGHWDRESLPPTLEVLRTELARKPRKPVINGEVCYEGLMGTNWQNTQRLLFWSHMLSGAAGHTYGAQGLWAMNDGNWVGDAGAWGDLTWEEAYQLPGSKQVGLGRRILERYPWWDFESHDDWVESADGPEEADSDPRLAYAAGTSDVRVIYFPPPIPPRNRRALRVIRIKDLGPGSSWNARYVNPRRAQELPTWTLTADDGGEAIIEGDGLFTSNPTMDDWLLVLERE